MVFMSGAVVVLTTVDEGFDAAGLATTLVGRGLASCVNVLPGVTSVYRWKGEIKSDPEQQLIIKTTADKVESLQAAVKELHPYDVPEFIVLAIDAASEDYLKFLKELD
jgi:periplasmic divalent cation tolerance protein